MPHKLLCGPGVYAGGSQHRAKGMAQAVEPNGPAVFINLDFGILNIFLYHPGTIADIWHRKGFIVRFFASEECFEFQDGIFPKRQLCIFARQPDKLLLKIEVF